MATDPGEGTSISVCHDGPLLVRGDFHLLTDEGSPIDEHRTTIALCRCGHSERKPFCDGSHRRFWGSTGPDEPLADTTVVPLTSAQQSLWLAQQLIGDVPLTVAQAIDISGDVDVERLLAAAYRAGHEYGITRSRLVTGAGSAASGPNVVGAGSEASGPNVPGPLMSLSRTDFTIADVDLRRERDPVAAGQSWMERAARQPLHLATDPLVETSLVRVGDRRWFLFSRAHHLVLDGFGALNLVRRTAELYRADAADHLPSVGDPHLLVDADLRYQQSDRRQRDRTYWSTVLADLPDPVVVGRARATPSIETIRVGSVFRRGTASALHGCASSADVPPAAVLIAGIAAYVARVVDAERIVVSVPVSARNTAAVRSAAGSISNLVPLIVDADGALTRDDFLHAVARDLLGLLRHQQYRHEDMLRDAGVSAAGLHQFGPVINVFPYPPRIPLGDVVADYTVLSTGPVTDLNVNLYPTADGTNFRLEVEANPVGFPPDAVAHHHAQLEMFLEDFCRLPPGMPLGGIELGGTSAAVRPGRSDLTAADLGIRAPSSDDVALSDGPHQLTFRQLRSRATEFADELRAAGIGPEAPVVVLLGRSVESVVTFWATALAGGVYVPVDPRYPQARIDQIIAASAPRVIVGAGLSVTVTDAPPSAGRARPDNVAYQIFTSGSTGAPKGVAVTATGLGALAAEIADSYRLGPDCVVAHFASPSFDTAIVEMIAARVHGARLHIIAPDVVGGAELGGELTRGGVTHLLITPGALATLDPADAGTVCEVIVGGDVCPPNVARRWLDHGVRVRCAYGPTETTCSVTISDALDPTSIQPQVPIGRPMPAVQAWVLDARLRPQPIGAVGELYVGGPSLARGYQSSGATASRFIANPFDRTGGRLYRTGDRVSRRADGSLDFVGRADNQLKIRGFRVETGEVDAVLRGLDGVDEAVTVGVQRGGQAVLASYVTGTGVLAADLRRSLRRALPEFLVPTSITVVPRLPLTPSGKVDRSALPDPVIDQTEYRGPSSPVESACVTAYSAVLGDPRIGVDHDFFASGGDSLSATVVVDLINRSVDGGLTVRDIFEGHTPAGVAARLRSPDLSVSGQALRHRNSVAAVPLTPAQRNVDLADRSASNLIPFAVHLPDVDVERLTAALTDVATAHPVLTAAFEGGAMVPGGVAAPTVSMITGSVVEFVREGFDLRTSSPLRIGVRGNAIALSAHHAAVDGASLRIILTDLATAYAGGSVQSTDIDYFDYAQWMTELMGAVDDPMSRSAQQLGFWRDALSGCAPLGPLDGRRRPTSWDRRGSRIRVDVVTDVWNRLRSVASTVGTTPFAVFRAAVAREVSARSGVADLVVGTPIDGRRDPRLAGVVGMFVNTLPVRYRIDVGASVAEVAAAHLGVERDALRHSDIGYVDIAAALGSLAGPHHPLFQIVVSSESPEVVLPGIEPLPAPIAKCDLHFALTPPFESRPGVVEVLYATSMFDETWVREVVGAVLESVSVDNPTR